jgi:HEAT repeat protein
MRTSTDRDLIRISGDSARPLEERVVACALLGDRRLRDAIPVLLQIASKEEDERLVWECLAAIGMVGSRTATRPLISLIRKTRSRLKRQAAVFALGQLADQRARPLFIQVLSNTKETEKTRGFAAEALGLLRPSRRSLETLTLALSDASVEVRYSALCGLAALRSKESVPALKGLLNDSAVVDGSRPVAARAAAAIRDIGESAQHISKRPRMASRKGTPE